jgi:predicted transposase YbfD/YdcC
VDADKTIEFLLVETAKHDEQIGQFTGLMARLADSQIQMVNQIAESQKKTEERIRESDVRSRKLEEELKERFRETDERIRKVVSAFGALSSKQKAG